MKSARRKRLVVALGLGLVLGALLVAQRVLPPSHPRMAWMSFKRLNAYELSSDAERATFKHVTFPFASGTKTIVKQGPFAWSHSDPGASYRWDFTAPFGTEVHAIEGGDVLFVRDSEKGGCSAEHAREAGDVMIVHADGTVAQYEHVHPRVVVGEHVTRGATVAVTARNGFVCIPHLDFMVFRSKDATYDSVHPESLPLWFEGVPGGILRQGNEYAVP